MKFFVSSKISLVLFGFVAAIVVGSGSANADFTFGEPTNMGTKFNTSSGDAPSCFSSDGLEMYFDSYHSGGYGDWDIWVVRRPTIDDDWGEPMNLGPKVNGPQADSLASISFNGLELYFSSKDRPDGYGNTDIWVTTRETRDAEWNVPVNLGHIVNSSSTDIGPWIFKDGLELFFSSNRPGGYGRDDIYVSTRTTTDDPWGEPVNLGEVVNTSAYEGCPCISADGLALFFSGDIWGGHRPGGFGAADMWVTTRASVKDPWGTPVNLGPMVNSSSSECGPRISPDSSMLYFCSERPGGLGGYYGDIYQASIIPIVDLNADDIVDATDMCIMLNHWGEKYSLCDIGPTPLGDSIVDVQDLIVLAEHMCGYNYPIAHWTLDEREGNTAYDKVGETNALVYGDALWQHTGGMFGGALEFDGINDYIETGFVLNPTDGPFSVFAWIKGGAPGQVVISQLDGDGKGQIWLGADPSDGKLMTGLAPLAGRAPTLPLMSEFIITEGEWHHVGVVAPSYGIRNLYVDGMRVASDTQGVGLPSSNGGLYFGTSKTLDAGTFFSGLIDDVRIYNVALTADEITALAK